MRVVALLLLLLTPALGHAEKQCDVAVQPHVGLAPLRYLRVKTTIERGSAREAQISLDGPQGFETRSSVDTTYRTVQTEWKNITLLAGEYEITLHTSSGCFAHDRIIVQGDPH